MEFSVDFTVRRIGTFLAEVAVEMKSKMGVEGE